MTIYVTCNGKARPFFGPVVDLCYEALIEMAKAQPGATVTYAHAEGDRSGSLLPGERVWCVDGTVINVTNTASA